MAYKVIYTEKAPAAIGPYSQAIQAGNTLYTSGQLGIDPQTGELTDGVAAQARQSLMNIEAILSAAGYTKEDVLKTTVFIQSMNDFAVVNQVYEAFFGGHKPARSCVEVARLPKDGLVEIEVIAVKGEHHA